MGEPMHLFDLHYRLIILGHSSEVGVGVGAGVSVI